MERLENSRPTIFPEKSAVERVCAWNDPLEWTCESERTFREACFEAATHHQRSCPPLAKLYERTKFDPSILTTDAGLEKLPSVGVTAMKYHLLTSRPVNEAALHLTSSGTKGQKTQVLFDDESLARAQNMLSVLWSRNGLVSREPANYLMFVYDPTEAKDLGIAFTINNQQRFAPPRETTFAIRRNASGDWAFALDEVLAKLREYEREGLPVRLLGMPGFIHEFLVVLGREPAVRLPPGSCVVTGGGWKAAEDKSLSRAAFRALIAERLGIDETRVRDGFGMAEHSAPYQECSHHRFHVPVYNRVLVRDPATFQRVPAGRPGLLQLVTPFNSMMPTLSLLTTDFGFEDTDACPCGAASPTFTLLGRAGLTKAKGCALVAQDIVKRGAQ